MTAYLGRSHLEVTFAGNLLTDVVAAQCQHAVGQVAQARVVVRSMPTTGTYDDDVIITGGRSVANLGLTRFEGYFRNRDDDLFPGLVTLNYQGKLVRAAEFENASSPSGALGGVSLIDLTGAPYAADQDIVTAVLNECAVDLTGATIGGTGRLMGNQNPWEWIWRSGTPSDPSRPQLYREQGQKGLDYIREVDRISAVYDSGTDTGGFYSTFDGPSAPVRRLIGGRPTATAALTFTEGLNILRGSKFQRLFPVANAVLVKGFDPGLGAGQLVSDFIQSSNDFMVFPPRSVLDSYSSPLIEFSTEAQAAANGTAIGAPGAEGMSCEVIKLARLLDLNREVVTGSLNTHEDALITPGDVHLVQGPGGAPGRLGVGEKLWCVANTTEWARRGAVLVFRQRPAYIGGGVA